MTTPAPFIRVVNEQGRMTNLMQSCQERQAEFIVCLAGTETSDQPGISAAGATPELRRLTPALDAEALVLGYTKSAEKLPVSPSGIVSPVVITRACLNLAKIVPQIVNCGTFIDAQVPRSTAGSRAACSVSSGEAMTIEMVCELLDRGYSFGLKNSNGKCLTIAECVPGGTTTALAVLTGLGYDVRNALSSSIPNCNHDSRWQLVEEGLRRGGIAVGEKDVLKIIAAVGDPMQPFVVGMALSACRSTPTILAGGSMMLAVYAICRAISPNFDINIEQAELGVITTKWVAFDAFAQLEKLSKEIEAPFAASCPDFTRSRHAGLRAYEEGNVKEGIGAGAAMALAYYAQESSEARVVAAIDDCYDELVDAR